MVFKFRGSGCYSAYGETGQVIISLNLYVFQRVGKYSSKYKYPINQIVLL